MEFGVLFQCEPIPNDCGQVAIKENYGRSNHLYIGSIEFMNSWRFFFLYAALVYCFIAMNIKCWRLPFIIERAMFILHTFIQFVFVCVDGVYICIVGEVKARIYRDDNFYVFMTSIIQYYSALQCVKQLQF